MQAQYDLWFSEFQSHMLGQTVGASLLPEVDGSEGFDAPVPLIRWSSCRGPS
jgi:hypothetical protein